MDLLCVCVHYLQLWSVKKSVVCIVMDLSFSLVGTRGTAELKLNMLKEIILLLVSQFVSRDILSLSDCAIIPYTFMKTDGH